MTDETDSVSEVARVLGEHYDGAIRMDAWVCSACGAALAMPSWNAMVEGTTGPLLRKAMARHQADVLAEAGLLRDQAALATAFESGARSYAAVDPCCGTYHLHEIQNPHTGEAIPRREGEDDL